MTTQIKFSKNAGMPIQHKVPSKTDLPVTSDDLSTLPTNNVIPAQSDIHMANTLFGENKTITDKLLHEGKDVIIVGLLFIILSMDYIDELVKKFIPVTVNSQYFLLIVKAVMMMLLYWVAKHFYLSRNS
jgi:hypothetical protein